MIVKFSNRATRLLVVSALIFVAALALFAYLPKRHADVPSPSPSYLIQFSDPDGYQINVDLVSLFWSKREEFESLRELAVKSAALTEDGRINIRYSAETGELTYVYPDIIENEKTALPNFEQLTEQMGKLNVNILDCTTENDLFGINLIYGDDALVCCPSTAELTKRENPEEGEYITGNWVCVFHH